MSRKYPKMNYKVIDHALQMLEDNAKVFFAIQHGFNIKPYSENYYNKNKEYFIHKDGMEAYLFVSELIEFGYLQKTGDDHFHVRITEKGISHLFKCNGIRS